MTDRPVYSTDRNVILEEGEKKKTFASSTGPCKMRLESNGRGGKQVTVLFNLPFSEEDAKKHMRTLQSQLGTGGTLKDSTIEFRGDVRNRVEEYFKKINVKIVRAGG